MHPKGEISQVAQNLLASAHHLSCMASTSSLAAAVLRREAAGGCRCKLETALNADQSNTRRGTLKQLIRSCQRTSVACVEAHAEKDIHRLRRLNKDFVAHVERVHLEVRRIYDLDGVGG